MHTASYEFLMKSKESAGCLQTLSTRVGSGDETNRLLSEVHLTFLGGDYLRVGSDPKKSWYDLLITLPNERRSIMFGSQRIVVAPRITASSG